MSGADTLADLLSSQLSFNIFGLHGARSGAIWSHLVNGRAVSGLDHTTLPLSVVERVEVLDEGSVRRNSFGIGSTIIIVPRNEFEGPGVSAGASSPSRRGMDSRNASAFRDGSLGRGHMSVGAAHFGRDERRARDRHYSRATYTPGGSFTNAQGITDRGNTVILPGDVGPARNSACLRFVDGGPGVPKIRPKFQLIAN